MSGKIRISAAVAKSVACRREVRIGGKFHSKKVYVPLVKAYQGTGQVLLEAPFAQGVMRFYIDPKWMEP